MIEPFLYNLKKDGLLKTRVFEKDGVLKTRVFEKAGVFENPCF